MRIVPILAAALLMTEPAAGAVPAAAPPAAAAPAMDGKAFFRIAKPCMLHMELPDLMNSVVERRTDPKGAKQATKMAQQCHAVVEELNRKGAPPDCVVDMSEFETIANQLTAELSGRHGALNSSGLDDTAMDRCAKVLGLPTDAKG